MVEVQYFAGANCKTANGKHILEKLKGGVWYAQCTVCGERFALMSETVIKQLKLELEVRPTKRTIN